MDLLNFTNYGTIDEPLYKAKDIGDLLDIKNIRATVSKLDEKYKTKRNIKSNCGNFVNTWLVSLDGIKRIIIISRKHKSIELCKILHLDCDIKIVAKETNFVKQILIAFKTFKIELQYVCLNYRIDLYFIDYKLAIEFDESHSYKGKSDDKIRQKLIEENLNCKFLRVKYNDDIFETINNIILIILKL
jgi:very-short-patch-repair endonuclease